MQLYRDFRIQYKLISPSFSFHKGFFLGVLENYPLSLPRSRKSLPTLKLKQNVEEED